MDLSNFLNTTYRDSSLYNMYRATLGIDGLKNCGRKCIFTLKKGTLKKEEKVSTFASLVIAKSNYLHGDASCQGDVVTLTADYCGANNLPLLKGIGSFGTRFEPASAAPRYIKVKEQPYIELLFRRDDDPNLTAQFFEGDEIEPLYYMPTLPLVLINGGDGIGTGFACHVLPRSTENMIAAVRAYLNDEVPDESLFIPSWRGFSGTVTKGEDNSWEVEGTAELIGKKLIITELPVDNTITLSKYIKFLRGLRDADVIKSFIDFSENDRFKFEVVLSDAEAAKDIRTIKRDLKIVMPRYETLTGINEHNAVSVYNDTREIFDYYCKLKVDSLKRRIESTLARLGNEEAYLREQYHFIEEVIKGTIDLKKKSAAVQKEMSQKGYSFGDKLVAMPLSSISADKAEAIKKEWENKCKEIEAMKKATPKKVWLKDIEELEASLAECGYIQKPVKAKSAPAVRKPAVKKTAVKKSEPAKKAPAKKAATKKAEPKKATVKKTVKKAEPEKKPAAKKATTTKKATATKKEPEKKTAAKKAVTKKAPAKKTAKKGK